MKLTVKQRKFVASYVESGNATQAAIAAGYAPKAAYQTGAENLRKPQIKAAINKRLEEIDSAKVMSAKEVMERLSAIARGELKEEVIISYKDGYDKTNKTADFGTQVSAMREIMKRHQETDPHASDETDWAKMVREAEKEAADDRA